MKYENRLIVKLLGIMCVLTSLPILVFSFWDYANGDDLGYGWAARQALLKGEGIVGVLRAACYNVVVSWHNWQGTWSSIFLFSVEPSIWGERVYILTPWIAVGGLCVGTIYFVHKILEILGYDQTIIWSVCFSVLIVSLQYTPNPRGGIYWYTSVAHYIIPYGIALVAMGWMLQFQRSGKSKYYIGIIIAMIYLGGAGYPELVMAAAWIFFVIVIGWNINSKRSKQLIIPLGMELIGFIISAIAPGNKVRGGEGFGFSTEKVVFTVGTSIRTALMGMTEEFTSSPLLITLLLIIVTVVYMDCHNKADSEGGQPNEIRYIIISVLGSIIFSSVVRMPEIYAGVGVSGGVPVTYHYVDLLGICVAGTVLTKSMLTANCIRKIMKSMSYNLICSLLLGVVLLITVINLKPIVKKSLDYQLYTFASSGRLADYSQQMNERLKILNSNQEDVIVPDMNNDQGPYMHMPLGQDPTEWTNEITASFYGKSTVIAIPREEFINKYGK